MTTFDRREDEFEKKFVHSAEMQFKIDSRRNKLLGLWAAEKLGLSGAEAEAYAGELVAAEASADADEKVFARLRADFDAKEVGLSDHQIKREMQDQAEVARKELMGE